MISKEELDRALRKSGYIANGTTIDALWVSLTMKRPLILEGPAGCGKTSVSKALAEGLGFNYIRLQMYEGLTDDRVLYDYDYQKMLIVAELTKERILDQYHNIDIHDAIDTLAQNFHFYDKEFLLPRPILSSIMSEQRTVLCVDELDKASEETEYMLYEFLENYAITIPQYKTIYCKPGLEPIVMITSNGYRELSGALRRRCGYLYIPHKTKEELVEILMNRVDLSPAIAHAVGDCFMRLRAMDLRKQPSVSEAIDVATYLSEAPALTKDYILGALGMICKHQRDLKSVTKALNTLADDCEKVTS